MKLSRNASQLRRPILASGGIKTSPFVPPGGTLRTLHSTAVIASSPSPEQKKNAQPTTTASLSPRWLGDVKQRVGHCLMWGLEPAQIVEAGRILEEIAWDWRELVAGSEGFLTDRTRRGLFRQEVVWGEMDSMAHVNNCTINRYAESGRVNWAKNYGRFIDPANKTAWENLVTPRGYGLILKKITTEFKFPMTYPDHVSVYHRLGAEPTAGSDTFIFHAVILSELHQRPAARCVEENVLYDYRLGKKTPLQPFMLDVLRETWKLQEAAKVEFSERVGLLLARVAALEKSSWDRPGAVESFGPS